MDSVFDGGWGECVDYGSLVLHAVVVVALVAEKEAHLDFDALGQVDQF